MSLLSHAVTRTAHRRSTARLFGWEAEPFPDGGPGVSLFRLPGYVGGEPEQPVPRDVVAAMMAAGADGSRPPGASTSGSPTPTGSRRTAPALGGSVIAAPA